MEPERNSFSHKLKEFVATGFFTGYIPFMPGTFGTLLGVLIYVFLSPIAIAYYIAIPVLMITAIPIADYAEKHIFKEKDSSHIVIDEVVGYLIGMISFQFTMNAEGVKYLVIGFILFRVFDIWKPYPIKHSQKLEGGLGIVIDDVLAGIYTNLFLQFLRLVGKTMPF